MIFIHAIAHMSVHLRARAHRIPNLLEFIWRSYLWRIHSLEMRHDVTTSSFRLRKKIDNLLYQFGGKKPETIASLGPRFHKEVYPSMQAKGWMPLYTMVTFRPDIGYAAAKTKAERQARILNAVGFGGGIFGVISVIAGCTLAYRRFRSQT